MELIRMGDVVVLRSRGVEMTVERVVMDEETLIPNLVSCVWFGPDGALKRSTFKGHCLKVVRSYYED